MGTIKSYTDIEQSRKLAKILPLESANMYYDRGGLPSLIDKYVTHESIKNDKYYHLIPCWSLSALLNILPKNLNIGRPSLNSNYKGYYWIQYYDEFMKPNNYKTECFNNPVDACVAMVEKLNELNLL